MRIILVSHGETEAPGVSNGVTPLSAAGVRQAEAIAEELRTTIARRSSIEKVYAGEAAAATATATIIAASLDLALPDPLAGLVHAPAPDGTSEADAVLAAMRSIEDDAWGVIERLRDTHAEDAAQVIAVAPTLTVHAIVCRALGMPLENYRRLRVEPASLSTLAFRQNRTILASLNETCFLDEQGAELVGRT